jgi:hypothetical protein
MSDLASQSLDLVSRELNSTLEAAHGEIEDYVEGHANEEALVARNCSPPVSHAAW